MGEIRTFLLWLDRFWVISPTLQIGWEGNKAIDEFSIHHKIEIQLAAIENGKLVERQGRKVTDLSILMSSHGWDAW